MDKTEMMSRTKKFALEIIKFAMNLPKTTIANVLGKQLVKSATSIGANYKSACRAQSYSHFISKISIVNEEADETVYWLELIKESELIKNYDEIDKFLKEANELTAIFTSVRKTSKAKNV